MAVTYGGTDILIKQLGPRQQIILKGFLFFLGCMTALRLAFYFAFYYNAADASRSEVLQAFYLGLKFDMRSALVLMLPLALLSFLPGLKPTRRLWLYFYTFVSLLVIAFYTLDFGHYSYLQSRANVAVFHLLTDFREAVLMLWQTYPVIQIFIGMCLFVALTYTTFTRWVLKVETSKIPKRSHRYARDIIFVVLFIGGLWARASQFPLRWSEAYFTANAFIAQLSFNPIHYFIDTFENRRPEYNVEETRKYYDIVADYLGVTAKNANDLNFKRPVTLTPMFNKPNIIVIVMESMAAYKTGAVGHSPANPTPHLDEIAKKGFLFTNYYVPSEATARSMFCLITGIADVALNRTSSRNPLIVDQHTVANAFKDYEKYYFLGGSANWGNIRGVFGNNVHDVNIMDEEKFSSPRTDVWGISDLALFQEAHKILAKREPNKPFLAFIQMAGFHRPYTIPEERAGFELKTATADELKSWGFISPEEYNSVRFADHSVGHFFKIATASPYFQNTLVVIVGDHGLPDYNAEHLPAGIRGHMLERFHTPLIFSSPLIKEPKVFTKIVTEPDILPTLAGITGHPFTLTTLGRNMFDTTADDKRMAFVYVYYGQHEVGLIADDFYFVSEGGRPIGLYQYRSQSPMKDVREEHPEVFNKMRDLTFGLYETSRYMLYHNPKLKE